MDGLTLLRAAVLATFVWSALLLLGNRKTATPIGARQKGRTMHSTQKVEELFASLEAGRVEKPEETLQALGEGIVKAVTETDWGTASLLALAAYRIDVGKPADLARIDRDLTRLFAEWDR